MLSVIQTRQILWASRWNCENIKLVMAYKKNTADIHNDKYVQVDLKRKSVNILKSHNSSSVNLVFFPLIKCVALFFFFFLSNGKTR